MRWQRSLQKGKLQAASLRTSPLQDGQWRIFYAALGIGSVSSIKQSNSDHQIVVERFGDFAEWKRAGAQRFVGPKSLMNTLPSISGACIAVRPSHSNGVSSDSPSTSTSTVRPSNAAFRGG